MLVEVYCERFRQKLIKFTRGLNVVVGDENAANSIGKSTALMVIDFVFGGNSLLIHNKDVVDEIGHHEYRFVFEFEGERFFFKRSTILSDVVSRCNEQGEVVRDWSLTEFLAFLHDKYRSPAHISFRSFVSLYSRVWGKGNYETQLPLHIVKAARAEDCVNTLIKAFDKFEGIETLVASRDGLAKEKKALSQAFSSNIIRKINRREYLNNEEIVSNVEARLKQIQNAIALYATSLDELVDDDMLKLRKYRSELVDIARSIDLRLDRIQKNLDGRRGISKGSFEGLVKYFPNVNIARLEEVEFFHQGISSILKKDLLAAKERLQAERDNINEKINEVEGRIQTKSDSISAPSELINTISDLSNTLRDAESQNSYYDLSLDLNSKFKSVQRELSRTREVVCNDIELDINSEIARIVTKIYGDASKSPEIKLDGKSYSFSIFEDTGTGKAFSNLIVFDLAIFNLTKLPILIHDSMLFKNVGNAAVASMLEIYHQHKQSFLALDEISKYGDYAVSMIQKSQVLKLSASEVLYDKDWR